MNKMQYSPQRQRGISLVEAMIAVLVLSIGLIGLASLQISGLRFNRDAFLRSQATVLAYDVIEQMRIDSENAIDNSAYTGSYAQADAQAGCTIGSSDSTSAITCWRVRLRDTLPGATLAVAGPAGADNDQFTVSVTWSDTWKSKGSEATTQSNQTLVVRL